jgi:hypothetical protein
VYVNTEESNLCTDQSRHYYFEMSNAENYGWRSRDYTFQRNFEKLQERIIQGDQSTATLQNLECVLQAVKLRSRRHRSICDTKLYKVIYEYQKYGRLMRMIFNNHITLDGAEIGTHTISIQWNQQAETVSKLATQ